jgi:hypothetical protein
MRIYRQRLGFLGSWLANGAAPKDYDIDTHAHPLAVATVIVLSELQTASTNALLEHRHT